MHFHCLFAQRQLPRDLFVSVTRGHCSKNLMLTLREILHKAYGAPFAKCERSLGLRPNVDLGTQKPGQLTIRVEERCNQQRVAKRSTVLFIIKKFGKRGSQ